MGFIIIAKAKQNFFVLSESLWTMVAVGLNWVCIRFYGLNGAGIAFFASYVFHSLLTYGLVFHLSGYRWSSENRRIGLVFLVAIGVVFCISYLLTPVAGLSLGIVGVMLSTAYSLQQLLRLVDDNRITRQIRQIAAKFGLATPCGDAR